MNIIVRNSAVKFQSRETLLLDQDVAFTSTSWVYVNLAKTVTVGQSVKSKITIPSGVTASADQIKAAADGQTSNTLLLRNRFNEEITAGPVEESFSQVGVYLNASGYYPVTVHVKMELV